MAEVVGVVAGSAGIASLACQIFESVYKLQQILTAIQDAPQELRTILEEVAIMTNVLLHCSERRHTFTTSPNPHVARDQALLHCKTACKQLFAIVSEIDHGMKRSKCRSKWCSILAVLKAKKIAELVARLERAKSTLALAQLMYLQSLETERFDKLESPQWVPAVEKPKHLGSTTIKSQSAKIDRQSCYYETTVQLGFGVLVVSRKGTNGGSSFSFLEEGAVHFRCADWFLRWGMKITIGREFGSFKISIRPHRHVPADAIIFQACALGDDQAVARLIQEGKASPFDITSKGVTPLHVAAAWLHPSTCKQLLEYGADGSISIQYHEIVWNALGLAVERAGHYRTFLFPELEKYRPEPQEGLSRMQETMRVLTDYDSVEVHQGYRPGKRNCWNGSKSALHLFRGSSEDFRWLINREDAFMTVTGSEDYVASIILQQSMMFPNDSFPAAFGHVSNMQSLAEYRDSSGSTLLHYLLDTNFGSEPGFWINGLDVFHFVRTLLEYGADPTARDDRGNTPMMKTARNVLRRFGGKAFIWTAENVNEVYFGFLMSWMKALGSCHIDVEKYRSREIESGAGNFMSCRQFDDSYNAFGRRRHWFVRLVFEQDDAHQELQIKFQFTSQDMNTAIPGAWPDEIVDN